MAGTAQHLTVSTAHPAELIGYLHAQTIGSTLRASFSIFRAHFRTLYLVYSLPVLPLATLQAHAGHEGQFTFGLLVTLVSIPVFFLTGLAGVVAVSDICVAARPGVRRSFGRMLTTMPFKVVVTVLVLSILFTICVLVSLALIVGGVMLAGTTEAGGAALVIAGVVVAVGSLLLLLRYMLLLPVIVLESRWGRDAVKRASLLGRGYYSRNVCVVALCLAVSTILQLVTAGALKFMESSTGIRSEAFDVLIAIISNTLAPLYGISLVILYYDMRVRKEALDLTALLADLF